MKDISKVDYIIQGVSVLLDALSEKDRDAMIRKLDELHSKYPMKKWDYRAIDIIKFNQEQQDKINKEAQKYLFDNFVKFNPEKLTFTISP